MFAPTFRVEIHFATSLVLVAPLCASLRLFTSFAISREKLERGLLYHQIGGNVEEIEV